MTPKEKAFDLLSKCCYIDNTDENIFNKKIVCIVFVNEIIDFIEKYSCITNEEYYNKIIFYKEVRKEIEKL